MNTRCQHVHFECDRQGSTPRRTALPQRVCAFGGTSGQDGKHEEWCTQRLSRQRSPKGSEPAVATPIVHEVLNSPGQPLDPTSRSFLEPSLGHDFSKVRIHKDTEAAESARAVNAFAYTVGQHVVFGTTSYQPKTPSGMKLLAHELTHTIQQPVDTSSSPLSIGASDDVYEHEANRISDMVMSGDNIAETTFRPSFASIQRQENLPSAAALSPPPPTQSAVETNRPARPSDPATQMSALLSTATNSGAPCGKCYHMMKEYIKQAQGYGDILDIQADKRFAQYLHLAVDFAGAVTANGAENLGLKEITGTPLDAPAGTILVLKGNGKQNLSQTAGDISVIGGVKDGLLICYNDGQMKLPGDKVTWESGRYNGTVIGMYQPIPRS